MRSLNPLRKIACGLALLGGGAMGCHNYDYTTPSSSSSNRTDDLASPVSSRIDGDWTLFPDGSAVAAVQRFYHDRFAAKVPTPAGTLDGACEAGDACQLWINDIPSGNQWQQVAFTERQPPVTYDLIVFAPGEGIKSHVAVVDHVERGTIFVMSSDAKGDLRRAQLPHGWKGKAFGWFHLKKLDIGGAESDRAPESTPNNGTTPTTPTPTGTPNTGVDAGAGTPPTQTPGCVLNAYYCGGHKLAGQANQLYRCADGAPKLVSRCANGCLQKPDGQDDECSAPTPCVVNGDYCGGDKVNGDPDVLYNCESNQSATVIRRCERGCRVNPPGQDDACN